MFVVVAIAFTDEVLSFLDYYAAVDQCNISESGQDILVSFLCAYVFPQYLVLCYMHTVTPFLLRSNVVLPYPPLYY